MSSVQLYLRVRNEAKLIAVIDGDLIMAHSAAIRDVIALRPPALVHKIMLHGPTFEAVRFVIDQILCSHKNQVVLSIRPGSRSLDKTIKIHRALSCIKVEPEQSQVVGHINGFLSHHLVTPSEMVAVHEAYGAPGNVNIRTWNTMVQTIAWKKVHGEMTEKQKDALKAASALHPALDAALIAKAQELEQANKVSYLIAKKRAAKAAKKKAKEGGAGTS